MKQSPSVCSLTTDFQKPLYLSQLPFRENRERCWSCDRPLDLYEDVELASCLDTVTHLEELTVSKINNLSLAALSRYLATLEWLTLPCTRSNRVSVEMILESCPNLISLSVGKFCAADINEGGPWVCLGLEPFFAKIVVDPYENLKETEVSARSRNIFERPGKLTCLTVLKVEGFGLEIQGLDFRLESGLGELLNLQRLRVIDFSGTVQHMSAADVAWIRANMKILISVLGVCNEHGEFNQPQQDE